MASVFITGRRKGEQGNQGERQEADPRHGRLQFRLVPALVSLQQWTFFYWEQNRYGMLIPFLTRPLDDSQATAAK